MEGYPVRFTSRDTARRIAAELEGWDNPRAEEQEIDDFLDCVIWLVMAESPETGLTCIMCADGTMRPREETV